MAGKSVSGQSLERLQFLHHAYVASGYDYLMHSLTLNIAEWSNKFPQIEENNGALVRMGTPYVSRRQVFDVFTDVAHHRATLTEAFVVVMAWGFRPNSYGPFRTSVMLSKPRGGRTVLEVLESAAQKSDPLDAYTALSKGLERLGPAFGTKFLYFTSSLDNRAPIFDAVVAKWLWRYGVRNSKNNWMSPVGWNTNTYGRYVQFCTEICELLGIADRGLVEYLMFVDAQYSDYLELGKAQPLWITSAAPLGWPISEPRPTAL